MYEVIGMIGGSMVILISLLPILLAAYVISKL
jgi:hypothetical protein